MKSIKILYRNGWIFTQFYGIRGNIRLRLHFKKKDPFYRFFGIIQRLKKTTTTLNVLGVIKMNIYQMYVKTAAYRVILYCVWTAYFWPCTLNMNKYRTHFSIRITTVLPFPALTHKSNHIFMLPLYIYYTFFFSFALHYNPHIDIDIFFVFSICFEHLFLLEVFEW